MLEVDTRLLVPIIIASFSGLFAAGAVLYNKIRPHIRVTVNCWFCNENSRVPLQNRNSFICSSCNQYNGFTKDGNYNKVIPAQRFENLNLRYNSNRRTPSNINSAVTNGLCSTCNVNQSLKVKSLADFQPFLEDNYDAEMEDYRQRLDRMFSLCRDCEGVLHQTLGKQNSWLKPLLISYRLLQSKEHIMKVVKSVNNSSILGLAVKLILMMAVLFVLMTTLYESTIPREYLLLEYEPKLSSVYSFGRENLPVICCISISAIILWLTSHGRKLVYVTDCCCLVFWMILLGLSSDCFSFEVYFSWSLQFLALLTFFATANTIFRNRIIPTWKNNSAIRIQMNEHNLSRYSCDTSYQDESVINSTFSLEQLDKVGNTKKGYKTPEDVESTKLAGLKSSNQSDNKDLGSTFGSLKIGTPQKNSQKSFSAKSLFSEKNHCILAEPKLFNKVTQASWVAGGYWGPTGSPQRGRSNHSELLERRIPPFSLSRSSSHSSGFVSQTSGTYNSLMGSGPASLCSEVDRFSQLSDSASMYPRRMPKEPFKNRSRSPTVCSDASCAFSRSDFRSTKSSPLNDSPVNFHDFSSPLNSSNKSMLDASLANGVNVYEKIYAKYCNPLVAFILGISITANFFLFFK